MKSNGKDWMIRIGAALFAFLWLVLVADTWARAEPPPPDHEDDEYSFNWLDPDKKIYVLQNRKYRKANHFFVSGLLGPGISNPYRTTYDISARISYFLSEAWGLEFFYTYIGNSSNSTFDALTTTAPNAFPVVREVRNQFGGLLHWAPWYAKINVFNKILYFDWYFSGGLANLDTFASSGTNSSLTYTEQQETGLVLATGQQFYLSQSWVFRIDFSGAFYNAPLVGTSGSTALFANYNLAFGLGLKL